MSLTAKVRFLVLNRTNQVIKPRDENLAGMTAAELKAQGEIPKKFSPSFIKEETARNFAEGLAHKYPGERFYVAMVLAGVTKGGVSWSEAEPVDALDDSNTASVIDDLDDGTDNE